MSRADPRPRSLRETQRLLWQLIVAPEGVEPALRGLPQGAARLAACVRSDDTLAAQGRLGVYANAYFARILGALEEDFSGLRAAIGEAAFRDVVTSYLAVSPPTHFSLRHAGERLAGFLAEHAAGAPFRRRIPWCADLARLDWALVDAFDAADSAVARRADLAGIEPERFAGLRFAFVPSLQLVPVRYAVHALRRRFEAGSLEDEPDIPELRDATIVCVWRENERVFHRELDAHEAGALAAARRGATFGALCELAHGFFGEASAAERAAGWLAGWLDDGRVASLDTSPV